MANFYYPPFEFCTIDSDGYRQPATSQNIEYYNITRGVTITTIATDSNGIIAKGSFSDGSYSVAADDVVELRHASYTGKGRFALKTSESDAVEAIENHVVTVVLDDDSTAGEPDAVRVFAQDLSNVDMAPVDLGTASASGQTRLPFTAEDGDQFRVFIKKVHNEWDFHAADDAYLSFLDLNVSTSSDSPPTLTSAAYDSVNSEVDLVFAKNGSATGNIEVEYKLTSDSSWSTSATTFTHSATSGSFTITEQPTAKTYDVRLKQVGVSGYSTTKQVTVDASGGGTPPSGLTSTSTLSSSPPDEYDVDLDWTAGSGSGNYTVERKTGSGGTWSVLSSAVAGTTYTNTPVLAGGTGVTYYYRVKQNDVTGYSNERGQYIPRDSS